MQYVLSFIRPDKTAVVMSEAEPFHTVGAATKLVLWVFVKESASATVGDAKTLGDALITSPGIELPHEQSGLLFRVDDAEFPPNVCSCCKGLVQPIDHAFAGDDDALCCGCYTWNRTNPQCLPKNTAHPVGYVPGKEN